MPTPSSFDPKAVIDKTIAAAKHYPYFAGGAAALVAVFALYTAYWSVSAGQIKQGFVRWAQTQNENGADVTYGKLKFGGFPYRYSLSVADFSYADPLHDRKWAWKADKLRLAMYVYNTNVVLADLSGGHELTFDEKLTVEARAPQRIRWLATAGSARASLTRNGRTIKQISVVMDDVQAEHDGPTAKLPFTSDHLEIHGRETPDTDQNIDLFLSGENTVIPTGDQLSPSSETLSSFQADLQLANFKPVLTENQPISDWAEQGGTVHLQTVYIVSDDYDLIADGILGVDDDHRLSGSVSTALGKYDALVDRLVDQSVIEPQHAQTVRSVFQVLAIAGNDPNGRIRAPLRFQDGYAQIGPAKIAKLHPLF